MRLGGIGVEFHRFGGSRQRPRKRLLRRHGAVLAKQVVKVGEPYIRCGVTGIMHDGLGKKIHRLIQIGRRAFFKIVPALVR